MSSFESQPESKSSVTIAINAKQEAQPTIKAYEGVSEDEMKRLADVAVETLTYTLKAINDAVSAANEAQLRAAAAAA